MVHVSVGSAVCLSDSLCLFLAPSLSLPIASGLLSWSTAGPRRHTSPLSSSTSGKKRRPRRNHRLSGKVPPRRPTGGNPTPAGLVKVNSGSEWVDVLRPPEKDFKCLHTCVHNAPTWPEGRIFRVFFFFFSPHPVLPYLIACAEFTVSQRLKHQQHTGGARPGTRRQQLLGDLVARTKR